MRRFIHSPVYAIAAGAVVCAPMLAGFASRTSAATPQQAYRVLGEYGLAFDTNAFTRLVTAAILTAADPGAHIVDATNAAVVMPTLASTELLPEGILYLKLHGVQPGAGAAIRSEIDAWTNTPKTGIVIDLRGAEGDDLDGVDEVAGLFLPENTPLYTVAQHAQSEPVQHSSRGPRSTTAAGLPVMLLVDGATAQASEALAEAVKNRCRVMLVGSNTRGEGVVRRYVPLSDEESAHLATARLITLQGQPLTGGIEPNIQVPTNSPSATSEEAGPASSNGRPLSQKTLEDIRLVERVRGDATLLRATDLLLGLRALRRPDGTYLGAHDCDAEPSAPPPPQPVAAAPATSDDTPPTGVEGNAPSP